MARGTDIVAGDQMVSISLKGNSGELMEPSTLSEITSLPYPR